MRIVGELITYSLANTLQVQSQSDAMLDVLKSLPQPSGERQRRDNATVKILLDNRYTRVGMFDNPLL